MASISFHVDADSTDITFYVPSDYTGCGCMCINITAYLDKTKDHIFHRDSFTVHGTLDDVRAFAQKLLDAVSAPAPPQTSYESQVQADDTVPAPVVQYAVVANNS